MGDTAISWADKTWNPTRGCRRISPGCGGARGEGGCYAERTAYRFSGPGQAYEGLVKLTANGPRWTGVGRFTADKLAEPLTWREPARIFVDSMSDLFFEAFTNIEIAAVFGVMAACRHHTFQVLTKRAKERLREWFSWVRGEFTMQQRGLAQAPNTIRALLDAAYEYLGKARKPQLDAVWHSEYAESDPWPLPNVWLGTSVEDQAAADERIPELLATPAAVRFLSCEPLLGPIVLDDGRMLGAGNWLREMRRGQIGSGGDEIIIDRARVDWIISGCESGHGARPCDVAWLRSLRDQCRAAGVPYFVKQLVVDCRLRKDIGEFPGDLRIQEFPR